jgi:hypothetical protein
MRKIAAGGRVERIDEKKERENKININQDRREQHTAAHAPNPCTAAATRTGAERTTQVASGWVGEWVEEEKGGTNDVNHLMRKEREKKRTREAL